MKAMSETNVQQPTQSTVAQPAPQGNVPAHYEGVPGPTKGKKLAAWEDFEGELRQREREIASMLPSHITRERFLNSAISAVKQNPDLLKATPRSLFAAVTKSAQDGILPDGREGVITLYGDTAQWNPMAYGLRKRARELDGIIIDAQVVCEGDKFIWHQGDDPRIEHIPATLGKPRGMKIGAYAIFKREDGNILHREVMDMTQIEAVRGQSKAANSLMWTKFSEEGYRKTVIRRGIKTVPVSEKLEQIVRGDDDQFDFTQEPSAVITPPRPTKPGSEFERKPKEPEKPSSGAGSEGEAGSAPIVQTASQKPQDGQAQPASQDTAKPEAASVEPAQKEQPAKEAKPRKKKGGDAPVPDSTSGRSNSTSTTPPPAEPVAKSGAPSEPQEETALQRGTRLLALCRTIPDVADLRQSIKEELEEAKLTEELKLWDGKGGLCDQRTDAITKGSP